MLQKLSRKVLAVTSRNVCNGAEIHRWNLSDCRRSFHASLYISNSSASPSSSLSTPSTNDWIWEYPSVIDVSKLAEQIRRPVCEYTQTQGPLNLIGILANTGQYRHDSELYSERIQETFQEDGIHYEVWRCPSSSDEADDSDKNAPSPNATQQIQHQIQIANKRQDIHGILVFYPIYPYGPKGPYKCKLTGVYHKTQDDYFRDLVDPKKDVEGLCGTKWLKIREPSRQQSELLSPYSVYPCTASSVLQILEEYHMPNDNQKNDKLIKKKQQEWKDQTVSIVNRSKILGRPLAVMLASQGATVYSIDIDSILKFRPNGRLHRCNPTTTTLETCLQESNILVTGVPNPGFQLPLCNIRNGTTIVNVSEYPNLCEETLLTQRPDIKYVPQVGKVTVAVLENNLMNLRIQSQKRDW